MAEIAITVTRAVISRAGDFHPEDVIIRIDYADGDQSVAVHAKMAESLVFDVVEGDVRPLPKARSDD